jgi:hypothetical protein
MAPRKTPKTTGESSGQGSDIISDTSPKSISIVKTWTEVSDVLQSELINCSDDSIGNEKEDISIKYKAVTQSEIHKIAARPCLPPYCDINGRWTM